MAIARKLLVRVPVDEINASTALMETDKEMATWARGMIRGLNDGENKPGANQAYTEGWKIGFAARKAANDMRELRSEIGKAGGRPKSNG